MRDTHPDIQAGHATGRLELHITLKNSHLIVRDIFGLVPAVQRLLRCLLAALTSQVPILHSRFRDRHRSYTARVGAMASIMHLCVFSALPSSTYHGVWPSRMVQQYDGFRGTVFWQLVCEQPELTWECCLLQLARGAAQLRCRQPTGGVRHAPIMPPHPGSIRRMTPATLQNVGDTGLRDTQ